MNIDDYQQAALATASVSSDGTKALAVLGLGIAGESGEAADLIKKHVGHGHTLDSDKVIKELGDVLWYVAVMADRLGHKLSDVATINTMKLAARYPGGFSNEASINRKE